MHRKAKIPFPAGFLRRRFSPCRPGSEAGVPGAVAPCIGKPKAPSPPGSCTAGSARAARVQPRGCKGRSPLHKKTKNPPLPRWGRGSGGWGQESKQKAGLAGGKAGKPPLGTIAAGAIRQPEKPAPRRVPAPQVQPMPPGFSPGDARGGAPCMKKTLVPPFPPGSCAAGSARAARVQKQGCRGR